MIYNKPMPISPTQIADFRAVVRDYYQQHGRHDMPWRQPESDGSFDAYKIMVSELMLQQTQVGRVIPKFQQFLKLFPDVPSLAAAPLAAVLATWSGLGYNRRAKFLHQAAQQVVADFHGTFPDIITQLTTLPGVGPNTAGAIAAYAFNQSVVFVETNIRTVYIHHFFADREAVTDMQLVPYIQATLDTDNPREWYWALMDYGSYLKQSSGNLNKLSKHYSVQSQFAGSARQIRGQIIRELASNSLSRAELEHRVTDVRLPAILLDLEREGLICQAGNTFSLPG